MEISNGKLAKTAENNVNKMKKPSPIMNNFKNYIDELKCKNNELNNTREIKEKEIKIWEKIENKQIMTSHRNIYLINFFYLKLLILLK